MVEAEKILNPAVKAPIEGPRSRSEIINSHFEALRFYHRAVLETETVEAIHKMRVTTRRLQASLDLLAREIKVRKLKRRLRGWRRKLSTVRNYDVFLELIEKESTSRGRTRREQLELVKAILHQRRIQRSAKVNRFLQGINVDVIALGLAARASASEPANLVDESQNENQMIEPVTDATGIDEHRVAAYAAERLEQRLAEFQVMAVKSLPTNNPSELHQLRIAAKRVRYLLEIVMEMGFGDASRALTWLRALQDRIGDWHDLEALEAEIIDIVSSPEFMKQHLAESSQMLQAAAHIQKKKEALVLRLFPVRVPRYVEITSHRIARALRRQSIRSVAPRHSSD
jgi:CHAD domain-containing protein